MNFLLSKICFSGMDSSISAETDAISRNKGTGETLCRLDVTLNQTLMDPGESMQEFQVMKGVTISYDKA